MGVGNSCLAKGTCGESATRRRSPSKSASKSASNSATRKRSRPINNSVTIRNTRSARRPAGYVRGITAFKRHSRGNTIANMNINSALRASKIGDKLAKKALKGEKLTPGQQKALKMYLNAVS
jgi:hypothetical protein